MKRAYSSSKKLNTGIPLPSMSSSLGSTSLLPRVHRLPSSWTEYSSWFKKYRKLALVGIGALCLLVWAGSILGAGSTADARGTPLKFGRDGTLPAAESDSATFQHLIMVAGHSVYKTHNFTDPSDNDNWLLLSYQQKPGQAASFVQHIKMGVEAAAKDESAVLLFSGGYTRVDAGQMSEAGSYWLVADALDWFGKDEVKLKAVVEDRARDSFENLLFSICRFKQFTGDYPSKFTIISYDFKRPRFIDLHARTLGISDNQIAFLGTPAIDPEGAQKGEAATVSMFQQDIHGCTGELLAKRADRDPYHNGTPDPSTCPALKPFLSQRCMTKLYRGKLPWQQHRKPRDKILP